MLLDKVEDGKIHDPYRIAYLKAHIEELKKAIDDGCQVLAYCTWSYTDLLSWLMVIRRDMDLFMWTEKKMKTLEL